MTQDTAAQQEALKHHYLGMLSHQVDVFTGKWGSMNEIGHKLLRRAMETTIRDITALCGEDETETQQILSKLPKDWRQKLMGQES